MNTFLKAAAAAFSAMIVAVVLIATGVMPSPLQMPRRGPPQNDMVIDEAMRTEVLERLIANVNGFYVFEKQAAAVEKDLRGRQQRGEYATITSAEEFAATLTADLQRVTGDRHLHVDYSEAITPSQAQTDAEEAAPTDSEDLRRRNHGFERVERLPFNIGYLDLRGFAPADLLANKLAAAMTLLADTRALVIDLRANGGGDPRAVALLASYLFDEPTRLNDIFERGSNVTQQYWTTDTLAGPRYGVARKVYLLIGNDTFSAAEDFAYALKNLGRATLIGASTGGGAHPATARRLNDHFGAIVPTGRSISPITHTDWEGVGVVPDIAIDADDALAHAQILILEKLLAGEANPHAAEQLQHRLAELR